MSGIDALFVKRMITRASHDRWCPDPTIGLALALKLGDLGTRLAASHAVDDVCTTGHHILILGAVISVIGGWGRLTKRTVAGWYERHRDDVDAGGVRVLGWSHRDMISMCHARIL